MRKKFLMGLLALGLSACMGESPSSSSGGFLTSSSNMSHSINTSSVNGLDECRSNIALGEQLFELEFCAGCHGAVVSGQTVLEYEGRKLDLYDSDSNGYKKNVVDGGGQVDLSLPEYISAWMPSGSNAVTLDKAKNIVAYLTHAVNTDRGWCPGDTWPPEPGVRPTGFSSSSSSNVSKSSSSYAEFSSAVSSSVSSSSAENLLSDLERGKQLFDAQCVFCHEATQKSLGQKAEGIGHDMASLKQTIALSMPLPFANLTPQSCVGDCADLTALYIADVNPFFGRNDQDEVQLPIGSIDAAPVIMTRLNRSEYNNTVRDLLKTEQSPADDFPEDNFGLFNNDAKVLTISLLHLEGYNNAAITLASEVVEAARPKVIDQCDTTQQCKDQFGATAYDCANSPANNSVCMCGNNQRCDALFPAILNAPVSNVLPCLPTQNGCAKTVATELGLKAWRRPLSSQEINQLVDVFEGADSVVNDKYLAMKTLIRVLLMSPNFIFRPEIDSDLNSSEVRALNGYELASRLSYFLWSSMPDDELFELAKAGVLNNDNALIAQVERMLADPKSATLLDNFAVQWIGFEEIENAQPYSELFPEYDENLKQLFKQETRLFLDHILKNNLPIAEIVNADYSFLNERLATHYGETEIAGNEFNLHFWSEASQRRGLLGHGSLLTARSHATKTSPVKRGMWVMERLMCDKPPEPTPGVVGLFPELPEGLNPRDESELHRDSSTVCYSCHAYIDPIGYGLENFNPIGQWRENYPNGDLVNANSLLPSGESFDGPLELSNVLVSSHDVPLCAIQYAMSYALGRAIDTFEHHLGGASLEPKDYPAVYRVYKNTENQGHRLQDIIREIVLSPAFRNRRGADSQ